MSNDMDRRSFVTGMFTGLIAPLASGLSAGVIGYGATKAFEDTEGQAEELTRAFPGADPAKIDEQVQKFSDEKAETVAIAAGAVTAIAVRLTP